MRTFGWPLAFLAVGLVSTFRASLRSDLGLVPGDLGDTLHFQFLLEHQWLWLSGGFPGLSYWDPPIGFPLMGALAHGDIMASFAPLYLPWRLAGADPETAYQFWLFGVSITNYVAMWLLLRRVLSHGPLASSIGAWIFAFSSGLMAQIGHPQLVPQFYVVGAVASVLTFFGTVPAQGPDAEANRARIERRAVAGYAACVVAQFWGGFYMGYFLLLVSGVALAVGLLRPAFRPSLVARLRARRGTILASAATAFGLLLPLALRYAVAREASQHVGVGAGEMRLPRLASYFFTGPENVLYGWMASFSPFSGLPEPHEQAIGLGFVTSAVLLWVAWRTRRQTRTQLVAIVVLVLVVALTWFPFEIRLWRLWYYTVPGLSATRAVSRIGLLLTIPAAIAVAHLVSQRRTATRSIQGFIIAVALVCGLEQMRVLPGYDKAAWQCEVRALAAEVDPAFEAFHLVGDHGDNLRALAVAQRAGVPTVNFVGGAFPTAWTLFDVQIRPGHTREEVRASLLDFLLEQGVDPNRVQVLEPEAALRSCRRVANSTVTKGVG